MMLIDRMMLVAGMGWTGVVLLSYYVFAVLQERIKLLEARLAECERLLNIRKKNDEPPTTAQEENGAYIL